jgi:hypothetical protein
MTKPPEPKLACGPGAKDHESTLEALRASPHCRRVITSGAVTVLMLSSPAQLAAFKSALKR